MRAIPSALRSCIESDVAGAADDLFLSGGRFDEQEVAVERLATGATNQGYRVVGRSEWFLKVYREPVAGIGRESEICQELLGCPLVPEFGGALVAVRGGRHVGRGMIQRWVQAESLWDGLVSGAERAMKQFDWRGLGIALRRLHAALSSSRGGVGACETSVNSWDLGLTIREAANSPSVGDAERATLQRWAGTAEGLSCSDVPMDECGVIHGDMHLGQVLRSLDGTLQFIDFEGEPHVRRGDGRPQRESRLRDVAGMLRSIGYLRDVVGGDSVADAEGRAFLDGYFGGLMERGTEERLRFFSVQRAFREWCYERAYRPEWVQRPLRVPTF